MSLVTGSKLDRQQWYMLLVSQYVIQLVEDMASSQSQPIMIGSAPTFERRPGVPVEDQEDPNLQDNISVQLEEPQVDVNNNVQEE